MLLAPSPVVESSMLLPASNIDTGMQIEDPIQIDDPYFFYTEIFRGSVACCPPSVLSATYDANNWRDAEGSFDGDDMMPSTAGSDQSRSSSAAQVFPAQDAPTSSSHSTRSVSSPVSLLRPINCS